MRNINHDFQKSDRQGGTRPGEAGEFLRAKSFAPRRKHPYEPDMRIVYHVLTKSVLVTFRGDIRMLGPFPNRDEAIEAAEDHCRSRGWKG